jgi:hypothetical protein
VKDGAPFPTIYSQFPNGIFEFSKLSDKEKVAHYVTYLRKADAAGQLAKHLPFTAAIFTGADDYQEQKFIMAKTNSGIVVQLADHYFATPPVQSGLYISPNHSVYDHVDTNNLTPFHDRNLNQILHSGAEDLVLRSRQQK